MVATIEKKKRDDKNRPATRQEVDWLCRLIEGRRLKYIKKVV